VVAETIFQQQQIISNRDKSKKIGRNALTHCKGLQMMSIVLDSSLENCVIAGKKKSEEN